MIKDIFYTVFKFKDRKSPDKLGLYPERVHTNAFPERRYLWSSRMLVILATINISFNLMLASIYVLLLPQKTSVPKMFHVSKDFYSLAQTEPSQKNMLSTDILIEADISDYIKARYTVTPSKRVDEKRKGEFSRLYWLSSDTVYKDFLKTENLNAEIERVRGLSRSVKIDWIKPLTYGLWQTQFKTYDYYPENKEPEVNVWRATMRVAYVKLKYRHKGDLELNPYGLNITNYYLSYAGKEDELEI